MPTTIDFYEAQAQKCAAEAKVSDLVNVRARLLRSAAAWRSMAERRSRSVTMRERLLAEKTREREVKAEETA
ncbi:MAG: hypothetical protein WCZ66_00530 [Sphingomonadaceae bacterium]